MSKNFAALYASGSDASALNQSFFIKQELVRGQMVAATNTDFLFTLSGGSVNFSQAFISSPHRSGRKNNNLVKEKTSTEWNLPLYMNIKQGVVYSASIDAGVKLLWKSALGRMLDTTTALQFDSQEDPSTTFTIFENLDMVAKQATGAFVMSTEVSLPGDGQAQMTFSGNAKTVYHAGIGKSDTDNDANSFTFVDAEEAKRFDVGAMVMIVKADGTTRSADTVVPRTIVARDLVTGAVTLDGAPLADADGTTNPVYLVYWEPAAPVGIDEPQTGLQGSISIDSLPGLSCVRSASLTLNNNHELNDYCYGTDGLSGSLFVAGGRLDANLSLEVNLNAQLVEFLERVRRFEKHEVELIVGLSTDRHFKIAIPSVAFQSPAVSVPENGSIPVSLEGTCFSPSLGAAEVVVTYQ